MGSNRCGGTRATNAGGSVMFPTPRSMIGIASSASAASLLWASLPEASGGPSVDHVIVVVMENKSYEQARTTPYVGSLLARGSSFSDFHAIAHPSQPDHLALW